MRCGGRAPHSPLTLSTAFNTEPTFINKGQKAVISITEHYSTSCSTIAKQKTSRTPSQYATTMVCNNRDLYFTFTSDVSS